MEARKRESESARERGRERASARAERFRRGDSDVRVEICSNAVAGAGCFASRPSPVSTLTDACPRHVRGNGPAHRGDGLDGGRARRQARPGRGRSAHERPRVDDDGLRSVPRGRAGREFEAGAAERREREARPPPLAALGRAPVPPHRPDLTLHGPVFTGVRRSRREVRPWCAPDLSAAPAAAAAAERRRRACTGARGQPVARTDAYVAARRARSVLAAATAVHDRMRDALHQRRAAVQLERRRRGAGSSPTPSHESRSRGMVSQMHASARPPALLPLLPAESARRDLAKP